MLKSVFFDIDNTLILFNENHFFRAYMPLITSYFKDLLPEEEFQKRLLSATSLLVQNNGEKSNADFFMDHFLRNSSFDRQVLWNRFLSFYESRFELLRDNVRPLRDSMKIIQTLKERGLHLVAASNPVWPRSVQMQRLRWAGIDPGIFDLIAHIENMAYCKPRIEFYQDLCRRVHVSPGEAMMVGNDPVNDMIAKTIGMKTYLTHDALDVDSSLHMSRSIRPNEQNTPPDPDFEGPLAGLPAAVTGLLNL